MNEGAAVTFLIGVTSVQSRDARPLERHHGHLYAWRTAAILLWVAVGLFASSALLSNVKIEWRER